MNLFHGLLFGILLLALLHLALKFFISRLRAARLTRWKALDERLTRWQPYLLVAFLIVFLAGVTGSTWYYSADFLPYPASEHGQAIVPVFNTTVVITGIAFFLTQTLLFYFGFRYRTEAGRPVKFLKSFLKLELFWIAVPLVTFLFLFIWGQVLWARIQAEPEGDPVEIDVMGEQFSWRIRYAGEDRQLGRSGFTFIDQENDMGVDFSDPHSHDDFMPVQMHVPRGRPVRLYLRSRDVIHSFFIPHMRVKMDALPGMVIKVHFTPTVTTEEMREQTGDPQFNYEVACAELCGRMHFAMKLILVVDEPEDFENWYGSQTPWLSKHPVYVVQ